MGPAALSLQKPIPCTHIHIYIYIHEMTFQSVVVSSPQYRNVPSKLMLGEEYARICDVVSGKLILDFALKEVILKAFKN